jgi:hypothetical protein
MSVGCHLDSGVTVDMRRVILYYMAHGFPSLYDFERALTWQHRLSNRKSQRFQSVLI